MVTKYLYGPAKTENCTTSSGVIKLYGRTFDMDGCLAAGWSNSGFSFNFYGSSLIIAMGDFKGENTAYVKITVDDVCYKFPIKGGDEHLLVDSIPLSRHKVCVYRITEGEPPLLFKSITISGENCHFMAREQNKSRKIEFVGDSITCGYGVLGQQSNPTFVTYEEDSTQTYAFFTAKAFGAELRTECLSGKGFYCNCVGSTDDVRAGDFFKRVSPFGREYDHTLWVPDVLVVNVGTNDMWGGAKPDMYMQKLEEFYNFARKIYPDTDILFLTGFMGEFFAHEIRDFVREKSKTDGKLHFMLLESIHGRECETGANGHPNVNAHIRIYRALAKKVASITGWRKRISESE